MSKPKPNISCPNHSSFGKKFCTYLLEAEKEGDNSLCNHPDHFLCTELHKYEPSRVNHSAVQDHMRCPKLDYYKNICGLRPVTQLVNDAVKMGNVWEMLMETKFDIDNQDQNKLISEKMVWRCKSIINANLLPEREMAIIRALSKAMKSLQLSVPQGEWQVKDVVAITDSDNIDHPVSFVFDVLGDNWFGEIKLCSDFKYYDNAWMIKSQVGLYLALNPHLDYAMVYAVQKPQLKLKKQNKTNLRDETIEEYEKRVYDAVIGNGRKYFLDMRGDLDDGTRTWGRRFDRAQFDMDELKLRAIEVSKLRSRSMLNEYWMMNETSCNDYGQECEFLGVCQNQGKVSDRFRVKGVDKNVNNIDNTKQESINE